MQFPLKLQLWINGLAVLLCLAWAIALSPIVVAGLFTSDNHIGSAKARAALWLATALMLLAGLSLALLARSRWRRIAPVVSALLMLATPVLAWFYWQANPNRQHWQRPLSAEEALARIKVPPGFAVELIAAEPDLVNPVALAFDDRGRLWVSESVEYPRRSPGPGKDCIKILEDTNGDGRADSVKVFADDLNMPTGLAVGYGGVWVANAPDLLFLQDTNGDDRADKREVVLTGFGRNDPHELPSSLSWGPDGWLYGLNGISNPSHIEHQGQTFRFSCALFRLHPVTRKFEVFCEGTSNPWGLTWDEEGSAFVSTCVIDHLWNFAEGLYYQNQSGLYPPHAWPAGSIVKHQHQSTAYAGLEYYDSDAYPPEFRRRLYMGNLHGGCLNVDRLSRNGATYFAEPAPDFLTAHDGWFMPIAIKTGPDGCLHVVDWYDRYHCHQDAERDPEGIDRLRGRIYRARHQSTAKTPPRDFAAASDRELVNDLTSGNAFTRRAALRLLQERLQAEASPALRLALEEAVYDAHGERRARLLALWALIGGGELSPEFHLRVLGHEDPTFRAWGVRAAGDMGPSSPRILERLSSLAAEPEPVVQAETLVAARKISTLDKLSIALDALASSPADDVVLRQAWQTLTPVLLHDSREFQRRVEEFDINVSPNLAALLPRAMRLILENTSSDADSLGILIALLDKPTLRPAEQEVARSILSRLTERVQSRIVSPEKMAELKNQLQRSIDTILDAPDHPLRTPSLWLAASWGSPRAMALARSTWNDASVDGNQRAAALAALVSGDEPEVVAIAETQWDQIRETQPAALSAIIEALGRRDEPAVGRLLLRHFSRCAPAEQTQILELLTGRATWASLLLDAIDADEISASLINTSQLQKLQTIPDDTILARAKALWGVARTFRDPSRAAVVARMRSLLERTKGDRAKGALVFARGCGQCHRWGETGHALGPDLTTAGRSPLDQLLSNVFDPNLVIGAAYQTRVVSTNDGRVVSGLLAEENEAQITLKLPGGKLETIPRSSIDEMFESQISLMPEGIERQLSEQEVADLFAFLREARP